MTQYIPTGTGKLVRLEKEDFKAATMADFWNCPDCGKKIGKLVTHNNKRNEFCCLDCRLSIPLFEITVGKVDPGWPPRNLE